MSDVSVAELDTPEGRFEVSVVVGEDAWAIKVVTPTGHYPWYAVKPQSNADPERYARLLLELAVNVLLGRGFDAQGNLEWDDEDD